VITATLPWWISPLTRTSSPQYQAAQVHGGNGKPIIPNEIGFLC
jgi:hypothetical protein